MMSGVPLETCWAFNKLWNNKFYYKAAPCWYFYWVAYEYFLMHPVDVTDFHRRVRKTKIFFRLFYLWVVSSHVSCELVLYSLWLMLGLQTVIYTGCIRRIKINNFSSFYSSLQQVLGRCSQAICSGRKPISGWPASRMETAVIFIRALCFLCNL